MNSESKSHRASVVVTTLRNTFFPFKGVQMPAHCLSLAKHVYLVHPYLMVAALTGLGIPHFCQSSFLIFPVKHPLHSWTMQDAKWSLAHYIQRTPASVVWFHHWVPTLLVHWSLSVLYFLASPGALKLCMLGKKLSSGFHTCAGAHTYTSKWAHTRMTHTYTTHKNGLCSFKKKKLKKTRSSISKTI